MEILWGFSFSSIQSIHPTQLLSAGKWSCFCRSCRLRGTSLRTAKSFATSTFVAIFEFNCHQQNLIDFIDLVINCWKTLEIALTASEWTACALDPSCRKTTSAKRTLHTGWAGNDLHVIDVTEWYLLSIHESCTCTLLFLNDTCGNTIYYHVLWWDRKFVIDVRCALSQATLPSMQVSRLNFTRATLSNLDKKQLFSFWFTQ